MKKSGIAEGKETNKVVRERIGQYGVKTLFDDELIAFATDIDIKAFEDFRSFEEIHDRLGLLETTPLKKQRLEAIFDLAVRIAQERRGCQKIGKPKDVADLLIPEMRFLKREEFRVIFLNTKNVVLEIKTIHIGSLNSSIVHPREVFKEAILRSSSSIILAHNHPSGQSDPSAEDISITKRLVEVGKLMGIDVLDHLVIGEDNFVSMKEKGIM